MAFQNHSRQGKSTLAEINVTPLVDVMLVLLIVFMISAPLMQQGVQVDLPQTSGEALDQNEDPLILVIHSNRNLTINENILQMATLERKLQAIFESRAQKELLIQADQAVPYGYVAQVMAKIKSAGITKVGLVTDPSPSQ